MKYSKDERTLAYCDSRDGGCTATESVLPEKFNSQYCGQCGKEVKIVHSKIEVEMICPNGHEYIDKHHKHCVVCGEKLKKTEKDVVETIRERSTVVV
ncbi:hypothetical protein BMS3Abin15_01044 [bacterium BMS3Abin15]|nr:hypothetical protein BMS3Abin15_01044 [bacterium BMS3Abin15]